MSEPVRLHRYIAQCGVCSRRKAETLIAEGRVVVNGDTIRKPGTKVTDIDEVIVDGNVVRPEQFVYLAMYKPPGIVTTMQDERGRRTVADILPNVGAAVKPVGRLDKDSEGLLFFTNDGELAKKMTHPKHSIEKEYEVTIYECPDADTLDWLREGVIIEKRRTRPAEVVVKNRSHKKTVLIITLREGRKRQIRLMCEEVGHPVISLKRTKFGCLSLKGMQLGECKLIGQASVDRLKALAEKKFSLPK